MRMENEIIPVIIGAIVGVVSALGLPKLWEYLTSKVETEGHVKMKELELTKEEFERLERCNEYVQHLKLQIVKMASSVEVLFLIISNSPEYEQNPGVVQGVEKIREIIKELQENP